MAIALSPSAFIDKPIKFGTDGWRGMIGADFTFGRVFHVAQVAAQVLKQCYGEETGSNTVIVGHDRRFLSPEFARTAAEAITQVGFDVLLTDAFAPTPAFSWAAKDTGALGAIVITASHNPAAYNGLKIKSAFGGSVPPDVTQQVEAQLDKTVEIASTPGSLQSFDPWPSYCAELQSKVDLAAIQSAIESGKLTVFADVMHGAAATGLERLLGRSINELNGSADPLFEGGAPEPLPKYLQRMLKTVAEYEPPASDGLIAGLVFDGDSDRIAAVDGKGNFLSSQVLIPILIDHLTQVHGYSGEVIKTISGSNLIPKVAALHNLSLYETPIGYKYIADRMLESKALIGGEESGGVGYGHHIPERDALLSALYVLESVVKSGLDLSDRYSRLQKTTGYHSEYDRIDLPLANMEVRSKLLHELEANCPQTIAGKAVENCLSIDGYKFSLEDGSWLLIRFSGTEAILRLYSEAKTLEEARQNLNWAKDWATAIS
ncbi:phosphoglucomutase/phosphomannomutase family protein [Oscillatoria sp. CS-180]|uniref:phosphoglucomutase/phosphomannomutase family protein n=1 Tax=Oscillatoria sp. CS-180 TaxID=3021720 RepID=UPI0023308668|nr:phosphoglucomutase/phosphomannomutase family protein [Oscillatoria sp. CS-180]MDB9525909.1 phosphoglucomutase/phosphomannomutase family protein [Oscillatoria sp. CS-180]